jgi:hypothetical protein
MRSRSESFLYREPKSKEELREQIQNWRVMDVVNYKDKKRRIMILKEKIQELKKEAQESNP